MFSPIKKKLGTLIGNSQWRWFFILYLASLILIGATHSVLHYLIKCLE
jgi:uncharacterized membrane protein YedE/YeeE